MKFSISRISVAVLAAIGLSACGGGGSSNTGNNDSADPVLTFSINIQAIDGYPAGGTVFVDLDRNYVMDSDEPHGTLLSDGTQVLDVKTADLDKHDNHVRVLVTATAGTAGNVVFGTESSLSKNVAMSSEIFVDRNNPNAVYRITPFTTIADQLYGPADLDSATESSLREKLAAVTGALGVSVSTATGDYNKTISEDSLKTLITSELAAASDSFPRTLTALSAGITGGSLTALGTAVQSSASGVYDTLLSEKDLDALTGQDVIDAINKADKDSGGDSGDSGDSGDTGDSGDSGAPAAVAKHDMFSSYSGTVGVNADDTDMPVFGNTIAINLSNMTFSPDGASYESFSGGASFSGATLKVTDGIISLDISGMDTSSAVKVSLTGTCKGSLVITGAKKSQIGLELNGTDITSGNYPAITVEPKTATTFVMLKGNNFLTDGRSFGTGYSSANGTDYYDDSVDSSVDVSEASKTQKWAPGSDASGTLSTKGIFRLSGDGALNISTAYKHGIYAKDRIYVYGGKIGVYNEGRNGLQSKNGFDMHGGTVYVNGVGTHDNKQSRGIIVSGDESEDGAGLGGMNFTGGAITIDTVGKAISAKWDIEDDAETSDTSDDPSPVITISGGTFNITTSGQVIENGQTFTYYDEDGIAVTEERKSSPEGIEGKLGVTITGGEFNISTTDDALNASRDGNAYINISGGRLYLNSSGADAIDSNGDISISGGTIVAVSTLGSEDGFDCDGRLTVTGGTLIGLSGSNHEYASSGSETTTQNTFVIGSGYLGSQNTVMAIKDASGNPVFVYKLPGTSYSLATLSSPYLDGDATYTVHSGVTVSGGTDFHGLYTELPAVSGGSQTGTVTTDGTTHVYTGLSQSGGGFGPGGGGFGPGGGEPPARSGDGSSTGGEPPAMP